MSRRADARRGRLASGLWTPKAISGLALWLRADMGITIGTGVSAWADQSGTGDANKNVTQGTGANQPAFNAANAAYNGRPTVDFSNASNQWMASAAWTVGLTQPWTEILVGHSPTGASLRAVIDALVAQCSHGRTAAGPLQMYAGTTLTSGAAGPGSPSVFGADFNGGSSAIYCNAVTAQISGPAGASGRTGVTLGGLFNHSAGFGWDGPIAEVIIYNRLLSVTERAMVMQYAGTRYNIVVGA